MSAYITLATPMVDRECLLAALAECGFDRAKVEVHAEAVALVGYEARTRPELAHVIVRRAHVGPASNDVGFRDTPTGYQAIISDFDRGRFGGTWLAGLHARYVTHAQAKEARLAAAERARVEAERKRVVEAQRSAVHEKAKKLGYQVTETREGEAVRLVLVKRTY